MNRLNRKGFNNAYILYSILVFTAVLSVILSIVGNEFGVDFINAETGEFEAQFNTDVDEDYEGNYIERAAKNTIIFFFKTVYSLVKWSGFLSGIVLGIAILPTWVTTVLFLPLFVLATYVTIKLFIP
jgi:hypothetical protein